MLPVIMRQKERQKKKKKGRERENKKALLKVGLILNKP